MSRWMLLLLTCLVSVVPLPSLIAEGKSDEEKSWKSVGIDFKSHDGHEMFGKLARPTSGDLKAMVLYVQAAEGMTVDMKRPLSRTRSFLYFDLYRKKLSEKGIAFFSYEGRGIRMGEDLPRFEKIDRKVFNTGTLDNKVRDVLSAIRAVRKQPGCEKVPLLLIGASEGTLLAVEAASRSPGAVDGLVLYGVLATNLREAFRFIMSDGAHLTYRIQFDDDRDGVITKEEFEKDSRKYRARVLRDAPFSVFDQDGDGKFTVKEMSTLTKVYLDAVDEEQFDVLQAWARSNAAVSVPDDWFKDHFAHATMWKFLAEIEIPVGCFHGDLDTNTPVGAVRELEKKARNAGKKQVTFLYFEDLDHSLNVGEYFVKGELPAGHRAIFEFIDKVVKESGEKGQDDPEDS